VSVNDQLTKTSVCFVLLVHIWKVRTRD